MGTPLNPQMRNNHHFLPNFILDNPAPFRGIYFRAGRNRQKLLSFARDVTLFSHCNDISQIFRTTGIVFIRRCIGGLPEQRYAIVESVCGQSNDSPASDLFQSGIVLWSSTGGICSATTGNDVSGVGSDITATTVIASACDHTFGYAKQQPW